MALLKLSPSTTVMTCLVTALSLMAFFNRPVLSLETGYKYEVSENWTTADRYGDLKCTYMFAALTHTRLAKLMLEYSHVSPGVPVGLADYFNSRAAICTLFGVADVEIGSLWLVHLYVILAKYYYEQYIGGAADEASRTAAVGRLADVVGYVADVVQKELSDAGCRPESQFNTYEKWHAESAAAMPSGKPNYVLHIKPKTLDNCRELDKLFLANNAKLTYGTRYEALAAYPLFLNNVAHNNKLMSKLLYTYDVQVTWYDTSKVLENTWHYVHSNMVSKKSGLWTVKKFYGAHFGLIMAIVNRLTWRHLLYVKMLRGRQRVGYLMYWYDWLTNIQKLLRLQDDPDFAGLLVAIDSLSHNAESIVNIIYQLQDKLYTLNKHLHCKATDPMILDAEEFPLSADQSAYVRAVIDHKSLVKAQSFLDFLTAAFQSVDFDLIQSLVAYVGDQSKWQTLVDEGNIVITE